MTQPWPIFCIHSWCCSGFQILHQWACGIISACSCFTYFSRFIPGCGFFVDTAHPVVSIVFLTLYSNIEILVKIAHQWTEHLSGLKRHSEVQCEFLVLPHGAIIQVELHGTLSMICCIMFYQLHWSYTGNAPECTPQYPLTKSWRSRVHIPNIHLLSLDMFGSWIFLNYLAVNCRLWVSSDWRCLDQYLVRYEALWPLI